MAGHLAVCVFFWFVMHFTSLFPYAVEMVTTLWYKLYMHVTTPWYIFVFSLLHGGIKHICTERREKNFGGLIPTMWYISHMHIIDL